MICLIRNRILLAIDLRQRFFRSTVYFEFEYIDSLLHLYHNIGPANSALHFCIHILPHQPEQMNDLPASLKGKVKGGGSLTALPIIETQAGDVSAYIPTNVISITDGQIFLETDLFNQGFRPAINVGISVSRVGGSAQIKSMKKVAGTLKIDQAQYRELEAFSKFSSDMDAVTAMAIDRGRKNNRLLIQPQYSPMPVGEQIAILYCGVHSLLHDVPLDKVIEFQNTFLETMRANHQQDVIDVLASGVINEEVTGIIEKVAAETAQSYKEQ